MTMTLSAAALSADIGFDYTNEELILSLERIMGGSPLPSNVNDRVNPYKFKPLNLREGVWYLVSSKENIDTEHGFWKAKGEACEVFSNSAIIGWRKTLEYYEGKLPHECRTDWMMQVYSITKKTLNENKDAKEPSSLCRVFRHDGQSPGVEMHHQLSITDVGTQTHNLSTHSVGHKDDNDRKMGTTSEPKVNKDDETGVLAVTERIPECRQMELNLPETDYLSRGEYLELLDLDIPPSPSSSSENSSCVTMSSDECFDSLALLQDLEPENDHVLEHKDVGYKCHAPASLKPEELVMLPASPGSLLSVGSSNSPTRETHKTDPSTPEKSQKQAVRSQKREQRDEGPSSTSHNIATIDGQKKSAIGRMKKLRKKYLCFMPF